MARKVLLVFIFFVEILYSQDSTEITIRSIKFEGLKRTQNSTMLNILSPIKNGSVYTSSTTNDIAQKLYAEHIFRPDITFDTVYEGNYVDITVYVKDRWTLIPIPNIGFSDSFWTVGALLMEENLFGLNKKLYISANYGSIGWETFARYRDPKFFLQDLSMDISMAVGESSISDFDTKNNLTSREYKNLFVESDIIFKYKLLEELSLGGGIKYEYFDNIKNKISKVEKINSLGTYVQIEYKKATYQYPFEEGVAVRLNGGYQFSLINNQNYYSVNGEVNASFILTEMQRIGGNISGGYGDLPAQREFRLGLQTSSSTLPQGIIAADYYSVATAFYEIAFLDLSLRHKKPFATLALKAFYEGGIYGSDMLGNIWHHGPGLSVLIYTPYVALVALEFKVAYDIISEGFYFSFALSKHL